MAIASEDLGLEISSNGNTFHRGSVPSAAGVVKFSVNDGDGVTIPSGAITQFLSTVKVWDKPQSLSLFDPSASLASCAEAVLGGEGGGLTVFLSHSLQNAVVQSKNLRELMIALIRRSVRILAVVDHGSDEASSDEGNIDDGDSGHPDKDSSSSADTASSESFMPDARFVSYLTGLLLSPPVVNGLTTSGKSDVVYSTANSLFEAWSIGLLSASMPWRMICALTVSGILNEYPECFANISQIKTLK